MTIDQAVEFLVAHTKQERYREHAKRPGAEASIIALAERYLAKRENPELPSLWTQAVNFAGAVVTHVAAGMPALDQAGVDERLRICETSGPDGAPCANLILPDWRCGGVNGCGCWLKEKATWADQTCPLGKWVTSTPGLSSDGAG